MMPRTTSVNPGKLYCTIYDFDEAGDTLPLHVHDETNNHITVISRGSFRAFGNEWEVVVKAGDFLDWKPHDPHGFEALEPRSRLVNIVKGSGEAGQLFI